MNILILEDDENLRELLCETLQDEGYAARGAANGVHALEQVRQHPVDLLILDVRMEGMTGLEAFATMRQRGLELACLVITGYATEEDSIRAIRLGVGDYLRKPFEMHELLMRVARLAALHQRQSEARCRETELRGLLDWLGAQVFSEKARLRGIRARQVAAALQLESAEIQELELAAAWSGDDRPLPSPAPPRLLEALTYREERWDGGGPRGLAGEEIPLGARVLALVGCSDEERSSGRVDPHLLFALDVVDNFDQHRQLRALLEVARGLIQQGRGQEAVELLQRACELAEGPQEMEPQLLLAGLEPRPLRLQRLQTLLQKAEPWGASLLAEARLEGASLLMDCDREIAAQWFKEAAAGLRGAARALCQLGLWAAQRAPDGWSAASALTVLLEPTSESKLLGALSWLGVPLLLEGLRQPEEKLFERAWRQCSSALVPSLLALSPEQRKALFQRTQASGQGTPASWLAVLAQDSDEGLQRSARQARQQAAPPRLPPLHLLSFGAFQVRIQGRPVADQAFRGQRNKWLLAYLARSSRPQPEERVREIFWPEELERGRKGLSNSLFRLRRCLRPEGSPDLDYFSRTEEALGLQMDWEPWHDLWVVEDIFSRFKTLQPAQLVEDIDQLIALTQAPYLDGCYMDWAVERREQIQLELTEALLIASQKATEAQLWSSVADWSYRLLQLDAAQQKAAALRAQALCQLGRPAEALRCIEQVTRVLRQEFELEPSTELLEWATRVRYECY